MASDAAEAPRLATGCGWANVRAGEVSCTVVKERAEQQQILCSSYTKTLYVCNDGKNGRGMAITDGVAAVRREVGPDVEGGATAVGCEDTKQILRRIKAHRGCPQGRRRKWT